MQHRAPATCATTASAAKAEGLGVVLHGEWKFFCCSEAFEGFARGRRSLRRYMSGMSTPLYRLPRRYRTGHRLVLLLGAFFIIQAVAQAAGSTWAAREMAVRAGGWFAELGQPLIVLAGIPVMSPLAWLEWDALRSVPAFKDIFLHLQWMYAAGLAIFPLKWILAQPRYAEEAVHGSARWASRRDIDKTGLLGD